MTQLTETEPLETRTARWKNPLMHSGYFRFSVARFLVALVMLFLATPFVEEFRYGPVMETALGTVVMCMGVFAVGARRRTLIVAAILVLPAVLGNWAHHLWPQQYPTELVFVARLLFLGFVVARLLIFILRAPRVNSEVLCAGISIYLLLGLLWGFAYMVVANENSHAFSFSVPADAAHAMTRFNAFYFSFMTLTTVGYGDITPVTPVARMLAIMEAMSGTLFVGVLIARLVSLYSTPAPAEAPKQD